MRQRLRQYKPPVCRAPGERHAHPNLVPAARHDLPRQHRRRRRRPSPTRAPADRAAGDLHGGGHARLLTALFLLLASALAGAGTTAQPGFDHRHAAWTALLERHVVAGATPGTANVRYAALAAEREALRAYLDTLAAVPAADYARWSKPQQLAFLINAYNAFTVELILTAYPNQAARVARSCCRSASGRKNPPVQIKSP